MNQYSDELERAAQIVVGVRQLHVSDPELYAGLLGSVIDDMQAVMLKHELDRQCEIPLSEFNRVKAVDLTDRTNRDSAE